MTAEARLKINSIANLLVRYGYRFSDEADLQARMADVLQQHGYECTREYSVDAKNRVDLWVGNVVIEVKVDGSMSHALHQVDRYINLPQVHGVILAGTPRWAAEPFTHRPVWQGKPFEMIKLTRQFL
ncbi:hypothetical protein [Pseudomonas sp. EMN2]|uniref:hypothetical protein n=1 Tax=Pseudomonas sp. EMN2 TaxID=2615212 RepID=UPI00129B16C0|nr:hypothetical protein [Pseudomonas sp. EMN2]